MAAHRHVALTAEAAFLERARLYDVRWRALKFLDAVRPDGLTDHMLLAAMREIRPSIERRELRRALDYLHKCDMLTIEQTHDVWHLHLTRHGIDYVEYTSTELPGIRRPSADRE